MLREDLEFNNTTAILVTAVTINNSIKLVLNIYNIPVQYTPKNNH